jgi:hypothetical protein
MTVLTMRLIKGDFIVTGPDIEPMKFKSRSRRATGARRTMRARPSRASAWQPKKPYGHRQGNQRRGQGRQTKAPQGGAKVGTSLTVA